MWMLLYVLLISSPPQDILLLDSYLNVRGFEPTIADCKTLEKYGFKIERKKTINQEFNWDAWNARYEKVTEKSGRVIWVDKSTKVLASK